MRKWFVMLALSFVVACSAAPVADTADRTAPDPNVGADEPTEQVVDVPTDLAPPSVDTSANADPAKQSVEPSGSINDPPAPGRYVYRQDGFQTFGALRFNFEPEGTFDVAAPQPDGRAVRQLTVRRYAESREREATTLFRPNAILLEEAVERIGSGATRQTFTCRTPEPVPILPIPWRVGASWQGGGTCDEMTLTYEAKLRKVENRVVEGTEVNTIVIEATYEVTGPDVKQQSRATIWFSPDHRLVVRQVEHSSGTFSGAAFERELTEELTSLVPAAR